jgi:Tol biopolymer transport system component
VSLGPGGVQANGESSRPALSADGRFVAFDSEADNLVSGDTNGTTDIFVRDRKTGTTTRVSLGPHGAQANGGSGDSSLSADGRYVAFDSGASNLVPGDTNEVHDVFVRDRKTGKTARVSVGPRGAQANNVSFDPSISADGRFVVFYSNASNLVPGDTNDTWDVFVHDRKTGRTTRASLFGQSTITFRPAISADGRYVAFSSEAGNLVPGDTNGVRDVFVYTR